MPAFYYDDFAIKIFFLLDSYKLIYANKVLNNNILLSTEKKNAPRKLFCLNLIAIIFKSRNRDNNNKKHDLSI